MVEDGSQALADRVHLSYRTRVGGVVADKELPLRLLVIADFRGHGVETPVAERAVIGVHGEDLSAAMGALSPCCRFTIPDRLGEAGTLSVELAPRSLDDFHPDRIAEAVPALGAMVRLRDALIAARECGVADGPTAAILAAMGDAQDAGAVRALVAAAGADVVEPDRRWYDMLIGEVDRRLSAQVDALLHAPELQALEASWRSLAYLVAEADFDENIRIDLLAVGQDELQADFEDAPEIVQAGLHAIAYVAEYGTYGGEPYAAIIADYQFAHSARDLALLRNCAAIAAMAHAVFLAGAHPAMFGCANHAELGALHDVGGMFAGPQYARWRAFRASEDARSVALTAPRFLLRAPYRERAVHRFRYCEDTADGLGARLWGNAAFALATRLVAAFARYRWCPNIVGPEGGGAVQVAAVEPWVGLGGGAMRMAVEVDIDERGEAALAAAGFVPLCERRASDGLCFYSANSCQQAQQFNADASGRAAMVNSVLGTRLPFLLVVNRIAHYLKVMQREHIGSWRQSADVERALNAWLREYVASVDDPAPSVRAQRPLREAEVNVQPASGESGWYRVALRVRPHFRYLGVPLDLTVLGRLETT